MKEKFTENGIEYVRNGDYYIPNLTVPDDKVYNIGRYMNDNIDSSPTVKQIAEKCCVSATSLQKIFMEYAGEVLFSYLSIYRFFIL